MEIIIGRKYPRQIITNQYKIVIEFMHGDADGTTFEEIMIDKDSKYLERFIHFLNKAKKNNGDREKIYKIEDVWLFVEGYYTTNNLSQEEYEKREKEYEVVTEEEGIYFCWPSDITCNDWKASLENYEITFFDEDGDVCEVIIKK